MFYVIENSLLWKRGEKCKDELISSFERHKKQKSTKRYCIRGGSSDDIGLCPIIRVSALLGEKNNQDWTTGELFGKFMRLKRQTTFFFFFGECSGKIFATGDLAMHHYFLSFSLLESVGDGGGQEKKKKVLFMEWWMRWDERKIM